MTHLLRHLRQIWNVPASLLALDLEQARLAQNVTDAKRELAAGSVYERDQDKRITDLEQQLADVRRIATYKESQRPVQPIRAKNWRDMRRLTEEEVHDEPASR